MWKVLLPVDGSDHSFQAVLYLIDLAKKVQGPIQAHVLNVEPDPLPWRIPGIGTEGIGLEPAAWPLDAADTEALRGHLTARGLTIMDSSLHALNEAGIPQESHVKLGNTAEMIVAACNEFGCDTIVMGTRGLGALSGLALGSVTRKVLHLAKVPVFCVKANQPRNTETA